MGPYYRDGIEEKIKGDVKVSHTVEGHNVESYTLENGKKRFFVTLSNSFLCAHGNTVAEAVADALWKDEKNRPSLEKLRNEIIAAGRDREITMNEFRTLTGACLTGAREALRQAGLEEVTSMTAFQIRSKVSQSWGQKLLDVLGWKDAS